MPIKLLYTLPQSVRLAYPAMVAGVRRGLSIEAITRTVRASGIVLGRGVSLSPIIRELRVLEAEGRAVRTVLSRETINTDLLPESVTNIRRKFSYQYRQTGQDKLGNAVSRNIQITTDNKNLTRGQLDALAQGVLADTNIYEELDNAELELEFGMRRDADF